MRILSLLLGLMMIVSCYAYQIVALNHGMLELQQSFAEKDQQLNETLDARLPAQSKAQAGLVTRHTVSSSPLSNSMFIIGDDSLSKQWLIEHAEELRELHALGFVTNIANSDTLHELQTATELPLLPANVDDLMLLLKEKHYPLAFHQGVVWQ